MKKLDEFLNKPGGAFLMNLLAQSGYSTMPGSPLGAVGRASQATQQQMMQQKQQSFQNDLLTRRLGLQEQRAANPNLGVAAPNSVREWEYFNSLPEADRERYLTMKRARQFEDIPGMGVVSPGADGLSTVAPEDTVVGGIGNRANAAETGRQEAEIAAIAPKAETTRQVEARGDLGGILAGNDQFYADAEFFTDALKSGELETGYWRGQFPAIKTEEQLFEAFAGEQIIKRIGQATFGALSEQELKFIKGTEVSRQNTPEANIAIIERKLDIIRRAEREAIRRAGLNGRPGAGGASNEPFDPTKLSDEDLERIANGG